jgi:hypothetical protein
MIRKWSYLDTNAVTNHMALSLAAKVKSFKVFRKTTKFKKFTKGITKVVRRKYTKRQFGSAYFILPQITKWWAFNYIQSKQVERFTQSFSHAAVTSSTPNFDVFLAANKSQEKQLNMHFFSCTKRLAYRTTNVFLRNKLPFVDTSINHAKLSFTQTTSFESCSSNEVAHPLNTTFDQLAYSSVSVGTTNEFTHTYHVLQNTLFSHNLKYAVDMYKLLIALSLKTLF